MYKIGVVLIATLLLFGIAIIGVKYEASVSLITLVVLSATMVILIWYAYDTHRIADQAQASNLRPIILRSGFIEDWQKVEFFCMGKGVTDGALLEFTILKNIATDISGYIFLNGNRHRLLFGNDISQLAENTYSFNYNWGWMKSEGKLYAVFSKESKEQTNERNGIYLYYKDVEGNKYFTREDSKFSQKSFRK